MEGPTEVSTQSFHARSISMPSSTHPTTQRVEEGLRKLRNSVASSSSPSTSSTRAKEMCTGLTGLGDLYICIDDLLRLPSIQHAFFHLNQKKWFEKELDESLCSMDLCSNLKDILVTIEELVQDQQSAHRRNGNKASEEKLCAQICSNKKTQKIVKKLQKSLKKMERECASCAYIGEDRDLLMVVAVLTETRHITISILGSILSFLSLQIKTKPKTSKWSFVSKAMHNNSKVACEGENEDEIIAFKYLEAGLDCLFRHQIQNRVSLLNILSL